jgi:hypothetical protein
MIRKQFDIYRNYESVRVLMVYCVTAYHCAVCMNRDFNAYSNSSPCLHFSKV